MFERVWSISDGHRKSFQDVTNVKIATAASVGRTTGIVIDHQIPKLGRAVDPRGVDDLVRTPRNCRAEKAGQRGARAARSAFRQLMEQFP